MLFLLPFQWCRLEHDWIRFQIILKGLTRDICWQWKIDPSDGKNTDSDRQDRCRLDAKKDSEFFTCVMILILTLKLRWTKKSPEQLKSTQKENEHLPPAMNIQRGCEDEEGRKWFVLYWFPVMKSIRMKFVFHCHPPGPAGGPFYPPKILLREYISIKNSSRA